MIKLTDDILMAYVDGELDQAQARQVKHALDSDDDARRRMDIFKESADMLQGVFDAPLNEPVPQRLLDTVMEQDPEETTGGLVTRIKDFLGISQVWKPAYAAVACIALIIGAGMAHLTHTLNAPIQTQAAIQLDGEAFSRGMEKTISGQTFQVDNQGIEVIPVATFLSSSQRYCRQYEVSGTDDIGMPMLQGIACRNSAGTWSTIVRITPGSDRAADDGQGQFIPAGDDHLIDLLLPQIAAEPPISLERESELIHRAWKTGAQK